MNIRNGSEASTDDFWHSLTEGYINPEDILESESDIIRVKDAILVIEEFYDSCVRQIDGFLYQENE